MKLAPFANEPVLELRRAAQRRRLTDGLATLELPVHVPVWIGDERRHGEELVSTDPSAPERVVALSARATAASASCLLYTSPSPRDRQKSRMPSSA